MNILTIFFGVGLALLFSTIPIITLILLGLSIISGNRKIGE